MSLPDAGVVANERRGQRSPGGEDARAAVVVAMRVDSRHVLHLVVPVSLFIWELKINIFVESRGFKPNYHLRDPINHPYRTTYPLEALRVTVFEE